jgi:hypothetical protein
MVSSSYLYTFQDLGSGFMCLEGLEGIAQDWDRSGWCDVFNSWESF